VNKNGGPANSIAGHGEPGKLISINLATIVAVSKRLEI
jgi:hypothetical protein